MLTEIYLGALLHDIGKFLMRSDNAKTNHSVYGYEYIKNRVNTNVAECVLYHHWEKLKNSILPDSSFAYIVYEADNIASKADRRKNEEEEKGFKKDLPLYSVFNVLNRSKSSKETAYGVANIDINNSITLPKEVNQAILNSKTEDYHNIFVQYFHPHFNAIPLEDSNVSIHSLLQLFESCFCYIPSSTNREEVADISLFDHLKLTAAIASCLYLYLEERKINNYKQYCLEKNNRDDRVFILCSGDLSGIQNFIYNVSNKGALKSIRGRSFQLELILENIIDEVLDFLGLNRTNLIYSGGGHFYILLPNTEQIKQHLYDISEKINQVFLERYNADLYLAMGYVECSANDLMNAGNENSLGTLYEKLGEIVGREKLKRYTPKQLESLFDEKSLLNTTSNDGRECVVCKNSSKALAYKDWAEGDVCPDCQGMFYIGDSLARIENSESEYLCVVTKTKKENTSILIGLCGVQYLTIMSKQDYLKQKKEDKDEDIVRVYSINNPMVGIDYATNLWVGLYSKSSDEGLVSFEELSSKSSGIQRLGVLRMDVDNLGKAFKTGFVGEGNDPFKYVTLSRFATLSRELAMFFKFKINQVCRDFASNDFELAEKNEEGNLSVVYSGGDDVFIVGAWDEVLAFAVKFYTVFKVFTNDKLTLSAGFGMYHENYPIYQMAKNAGKLEKAAKENDKDSISLFGMEPAGPNNEISCRHIYHWEEFIEGVYREKYQLMNRWCNFHEASDAEKINIGNSALYKLLNLLRGAGKEKINVARLAYQLGRMEPDKNATKGKKENYQLLCKNFMSWATDEKERKQLITAILMIIYINRKGE